MRSRLAWVAGGVGVGAALVYRLFRRTPLPGPTIETADVRADELRSRIAESRALVDEREEFEAGETPVDLAEPAEPAEPVDERRRHVHERGQSAVERMRKSVEP
jgi:hypothetical protein